MLVGNILFECICVFPFSNFLNTRRITAQQQSILKIDIRRSRTSSSNEEKKNVEGNLIIIASVRNWIKINS